MPCAFLARARTHALDRRVGLRVGLSPFMLLSWLVLRPRAPLQLRWRVNNLKCRRRDCRQCSVTVSAPHKHSPILALEVTWKSGRAFTCGGHS